MNETIYILIVMFVSIYVAGQIDLTFMENECDKEKQTDLNHKKV
jgi:hypothetical protein